MPHPIPSAGYYANETNIYVIFSNVSDRKLTSIRFLFSAMRASRSASYSEPWLACVAIFEPTILLGWQKCKNIN